MENNWTDKYRLNIDEIDSQHRKFFELWNEKCSQADNNNHPELVQIIEELENYLNYHFLFEEKLLKKSSFHDFKSHVAEHRFFILKVQELKHELNYKNPLLFEKIAVFMKKWFLGHIMQSDKKYQNTVFEYLNNNAK